VRGAEGEREGEGEREREREREGREGEREGGRESNTVGPLDCQPRPPPLKQAS
jgi:hypothetical protein